MKEWRLPAKADGEFVACMEDVLDVYHRPYDPSFPVVCMDEMPFQLLGDSRVALEMRPGDDRTVDYEYVRKGTGSVFMFNEPLGGWRSVSVRGHRTAVDWAQELRAIVDLPRYKDATKIVVVLDNLNTHARGSLYKAFRPEEARRILDRVELHHTPKHGSWLNTAECELSVLARQCLDRRIDSIGTLREETAAWAGRRNSECHGVKWHFTTKDARVRLMSLYPTYVMA